MYKYFFLHNRDACVFSPCFREEKQSVSFNFGEGASIGFFAEQGTSITSLKSHRKTITNKFELDFLDETLLLSGESERFWDIRF